MFNKNINAFSCYIDYVISLDLDRFIVGRCFGRSDFDILNWDRDRFTLIKLRPGTGFVYVRVLLKACRVGISL